MNVDTASESIVCTVAERNIDGSDRVGMYTYADTVYPLPPTSTAAFQPVWRGHRKYELKNHLGNVVTVVSGHKIPVQDGSSIGHFTAQIDAAYDYSPFGVTRMEFGEYRYGFNGKEKDDEVSGKGNQYDYGFRVYNSRLGKFLSKDPLFKNYAMLTPYQFASNTPVQAIDLDGLEAIQVTGWMEKGTVFRTQTFHDNFTSDLRVHYILHDVGTGTSTELWVNPIEIKYEPSAGERLLTGIRDAGNYVSDRFTSFDRMMKDKAKGMPTLEGEAGLVKVSKGYNDVGTGLLLTPLAPVGEVLIGGSLLIDTALDFKNKSKEEASTNLAVRLSLFGAGRVVTNSLTPLSKSSENSEMINRAIDFGVEKALGEVENELTE